MKAPAFWYRAPGAFAALLAPLGAGYGFISARAMARPPLRPSPVPVICVGNFVVGGAGKTPTALALADLIRRSGRKAVFLTRGYGGRFPGPLMVDPACHGAWEVGDEALLLARTEPTVVSRHRADGLDLVAGSGADLCVMDDGFQNFTVEKALSLVVVDGVVGVGNGCVMPAGPLRAPLDRQLARADALAIIGDGAAGDKLADMAAQKGKPVFRARIEAAGGTLPPGKPLYAFAGIGRPEKFFAQLAAEGLSVAGTRAFPDHHAFTEKDAIEILAEAAALGATPVTTEKDAMRLRGTGGTVASLASRLGTLPIVCRFETPDAVMATLDAALAARRTVGGR